MTFLTHKCRYIYTPRISYPQTHAPDSDGVGHTWHFSLISADVFTRLEYHIHSCTRLWLRGAYAIHLTDKCRYIYTPRILYSHTPWLWYLIVWAYMTFLTNRCGYICTPRIMHSRTHRPDLVTWLRVAYVTLLTHMCRHFYAPRIL